MKKGLIGVCLIAAFFFAYVAQAGTIEEYSADMVNVQDSKVVQKMYVTKEKMRFEAYGATGNVEIISIIRLDQGKMYALQVANKTYFEFPVNKEFKSIEDLTKGVMGAKVKTERKSLGTEEVNGYAAEKSKVTTNVDMMGQKVTMEHTEWVAEEFAPMPVRVEDPQTKSVNEMRDIKTEAQDDALFEIPAGYTKDTSMEEMMKDMGQAGQTPQ